MSRPTNGPLPAWLDPLSRAAESLYAAELARRTRRFDAGRGVVTMDRPVISIGNLTVGGTGKTPMVAWVLERLTGQGRSPCVAMRGYRSRGGESDEAVLYRQRFPDVPVVARPARVEGLIDLFDTPEGEAVDVIVLDDGFQHRRLARQLDLVLIDAAQRPGVFESGLLPRGWLREPPSALGRAHAVVLTHSDRAEPDRVGAIRAACQRINPRLTVALARHAWESLLISTREAVRVEPVGWLGGRRVLAVCAIGRPERFLRQLERSGASLAGVITLPDHDPYAPGTVRRIARRAARAAAECVVTTEKDWTKLGRAAGSLPTPVVRPRLALQLFEGDADIRELIASAAAVTPT